MQDSSIEKLTDEIIASQKMRSDYMKWKIIAIAALGTTAFGLDQKIIPLNMRFVILGLIPLVCFYIDTMCYSVSLRIAGIGRFLEIIDENMDNAIVKYEKFIRNQAHSYIRWEHIDAVGSTIVVSLFVAIYAFFNKIEPYSKAAVFISITGAVFCLFAYRKYSNERKRINSSLGNACSCCNNFKVSSATSQNKICETEKMFCLHFVGKNRRERLKRELGTFFLNYKIEKAKMDDCEKCKYNPKKCKKEIKENGRFCSNFRRNDSLLYWENL